MVVAMATQILGSDDDRSWTTVPVFQTAYLQNSRNSTLQYSTCTPEYLLQVTVRCTSHQPGTRVAVFYEMRSV
jgi:hypothetical protein